MEIADEEPMNKDEEEWCFFHQIGYAMSMWALVEYQLHVLAVLALAPKDRFVFYSAYTGIENFRSKVGFVDRAISKGIQNEELKTDWEKLADRILTVSTKRNKLVHWGFVGYPVSPKSGRRISLEPTYREIEPVQMRLEPPQDALCLLEINVLSQEFYQLFLGVSEFAHRIAGKSENLILKSLVRPVCPLTIRQLEDQMRVAFGRQPRPSRA